MQGIATTLMLLSQLGGWLRTGQASDPGLTGPFLAVLLCWLAVTWGLCLGGLLHAFWPAQRGTGEVKNSGARPPLTRRQTWAVYGVPMGLLGLIPLFLLTAQPWRGGDDEGWSATAEARLLSNTSSYGLHGDMCRGPFLPAQFQGSFCLYAPTDGETLALLLQDMIREADARIAEGDRLPLIRRGNTVGGTVRLSAYGNDFRRYPITLEYRGLVYVGRRGPLSDEERWLEAQPYKAYALVRSGHD